MVGDEPRHVDRYRRAKERNIESVPLVGDRGEPLLARGRILRPGGGAGRGCWAAASRTATNGKPRATAATATCCISPQRYTRRWHERLSRKEADACERRATRASERLDLSGICALRGGP